LRESVDFAEQLGPMASAMKPDLDAADAGKEASHPERWARRLSPAAVVRRPCHGW